MIKCESVDAFVAIDLPEAPVAYGVVRSARKILPDGAKNLARMLTYTYGRYGVEASGASAGVNADDETRAGAVAAFVDEMSHQAASGSLYLRAGKGTGSSAVSPLASPSGDPDDEPWLTADGVVAAARAVSEHIFDSDVLGDRTVQIEEQPFSAALTAAFVAAGVEPSVVATQDLADVAADILIIGSRPGVADHEVVAQMSCSAIIASSPLPLTARALAESGRRGIVYIPDFVSAAGAELVRCGAAADSAEAGAMVSEAVRTDLASDESAFMAACLAAETNLATWTDALPFGRPLA